MNVADWCVHLALCDSINHEFPLRKFMNDLRKLCESMNDVTIECTALAAKTLYKVHVKHAQCRDSIVSTAVRIILKCKRPAIQEQFVALITNLKSEVSTSSGSCLFYHIRVHLIQLADIVMRSSDDSAVCLKFIHLLERVILSLVGHPYVILQLLYLDFSMITRNQINYIADALSSAEVDEIIAKTNNIEACCADVINMLSKRGSSAGDASIEVGIVQLFATIALTAFELVGAKIIVILTKKRANTSSNELRLVSSALLFDLVTAYPANLWNTVLMTTLKDDLMAKKASIQSFTITAFCRILRVSLYLSVPLDLHQHAFVDVICAILTQSKMKQRIDQHITQYHHVDDFHCLLNESNELQLPLFIPNIRGILDDLRHVYGRSRSEYKKYAANVLSKLIQRIYELVVLRIHDENVPAMYTSSYILLLLQQYYHIISVYFTHNDFRDLELSSTTGAITNATHLYCSLAHEAFEVEFDVDMLHDVFHTFGSLDIAAAFQTGVNSKH